MGQSAVVLLSGGLDSATCLAIAAKRGYRCHALSFDYGQRSAAEVESARRQARNQEVVEHRVLKLPLGQFGGSALTDSNIRVPESPSEGIPATYVPARNTIFLSNALAWAEVIGAGAIFIGVNALDYSGYPDCRPEYIEAFQQLVDVATKAGVEGRKITLEAPLIHMSKAEIIRAGTELGVDYADTLSCYQADEQGLACGQCDSCRLRREGFAAAGIADPTRYRPA
ncbi:MAG: 7-cyano-7-deazaguanine synthase QueC [Gammaproteobacteria bacterium]|nr:7-cyano-7-deazaguanine synthase QueC [Gammaproteobacteria bacterium]MCY3687545.1 7-cyano-7-deazaguanine synthase QueC [Gammaproteobacteria bacterium]MDE0479248.1 7-cyano-7-deazaguanine synthase QueC [Gammaproteobacteria bacterium]MDE0509740.1 7-cyano-7-deazaguanine synthase QueC [Gammaproteobacteria bacterium]